MAEANLIMNVRVNSTDGYTVYYGDSGEFTVDSGTASGATWTTGNGGYVIDNSSNYYRCRDDANIVWVDISSAPAGIGMVVELPNNYNRKENEMIDRQTFLDALGDEGKSVDSEGRDIIKEAKAEKWELFIARLLARAFESADLAMLKEKPKEVLVKEA